MHGHHSSVRAWSLVLIVLTMNLAMLPVTAETDGEENGTETLRDGRVIGVLTSPDQTYERTWFIEQDEWLSLSFECSLCTVLLEIDGTTSEITNQIAYQAIQNGTASMKITSPVAEFVSYSLIERIDETNPTVRPSLEKRSTAKRLGYALIITDVQTFQMVSKQYLPRNSSMGSLF